MLLSKKEYEIFKLLNPTIKGLGYILWGIKLFHKKKKLFLIVFIDHKNNISINDCENVSNQISYLLDIENIIQKYYILEVSSPGINRFLFFPFQCQFYYNKKIKIWMYSDTDKNIIIGFLKKMYQDSILIKKKKEERILFFHSIKKIQVIL